MKRTTKEKPATTGDSDQMGTRVRRRAIERWENEGGSPEPTPETASRTANQSRRPAVDRKAP